MSGWLYDGAAARVLSREITWPRVHTLQRRHVVHQVPVGRARTCARVSRSGGSCSGAGGGGESCPSRVPIDTAAGTEAAAPESSAAAAVADAAADLTVVTEEDLDGLRDKQDMCKIRGVAIYGAKPLLIKRLMGWRPGTKRSCMGRKGAGAAAGDAVSRAVAGVASEDEEEPT